MPERPRGEDAVLVAVQDTLGELPGVLPGARALSHFGEHSLGWLGIAATGALLSPARRADYIAAGVGAFLAHATAVLVKRVVRRPRPHHPAIAVNVGTPSRLSFPSAHATSTAAAAVLLARPAKMPLPALLVPPMALSRLVLGVHYPTDVLAGIAVGTMVGKAVGRYRDKVAERVEGGAA